MPEAIAAYGQGGAYADFAERVRGQLVPGMAADTVLVEGDPAGLATSAGACRIRQVISAGTSV